MILTQRMDDLAFAAHAIPLVRVGPVFGEIVSLSLAVHGSTL